MAARTYIVRNLGQFENEGFDICATDFCQVYLGLDTEHPLATQAVEETRGLIATYDGEPINALYSSTCGGQTEDAENVFGERVPYLVSTICHYEHPEPQPFASSTIYKSWEDGLLGVAQVENFQDAARFLGILDVGAPSGGSPGTPPSNRDDHTMTARVGTAAARPGATAHQVGLCRVQCAGRQSVLACIRFEGATALVARLDMFQPKSPACGQCRH